MKHTILLAFCLIGFKAIYAQSETHQTVQQLPNGVSIVQTKGVEYASQNTFKPNPVRTIEDWNLAECEEALRVLQEKVAKTATSEENYAGIIAYYKEQEQKIQNRKESIIQKLSK